MTGAREEQDIAPIGGDVRCMDCGALYRDFPLDTTLPDEQWRQIHPNDGGVLCASCMVKRGAMLPRVIALRARFEFANEPYQLAAAEARLRAVEQANTDPEQGVVMHLLKELNPECGCAVCEVLYRVNRLR